MNSRDELWCPHCLRMYYGDSDHVHCPECGHPGVCDDCVREKYDSDVHDPQAWQSEPALSPDDRIILFSEDSDRVGHAIECGGNVNVADRNGMTALMRAAKHGSENKAWRLIFEGADVDAVDNDGYTALMFAAENGFTDIAKELLDNNAYVNAVSKTGWTPMTLAYIGNHIEMMRVLAGYGANVNQKNSAAGTLLMQAVITNEPAKVGLLIENGADVSIKDKWGSSALDWARQLKRGEILKILEEALKKAGLCNQARSPRK